MSTRNKSGADKWKAALVGTNINRIKWEKIVKVKNSEVERILPKRKWKRKGGLGEFVSQKKELRRWRGRRAAAADVYVPDGPGLEMVPVVEEFPVVADDDEGFRRETENVMRY